MITTRRYRHPTCKFGDIFEIRTAEGLAYMQYVNHDSQMGELMHVLPGLYDNLPVDFIGLVEQRERFVTFFSLVAAVKRQIVRYVDNVEVPALYGPFPVLRSPGYVDPKTNKIERWWLWDGNSSWRVNELSDAEKNFSLNSIMNDTLLIERIVNGWTPADFQRFTCSQSPMRLRCSR
jgi:hypothetical protein